MKKTLLLAATVALVGAPIAQPIFTLTTDGIQSVQAQTSQLVALGGSVDQVQAQQTLQLLGASDADPSSILYVDGTIINKYLQDGSTADTIVYSSALIQPMNAGYGVQVQIVTPQNITSVSATTYQNAAITAGATNAQIKIATVSPVTGEGALAGVYALLEQQGVAVNPQDVQVAQNEITLISEITQNQTVEISDQQINQMISEIKQEVINNNINAENSNVEVDNSKETNITNIVNNVTNNYGITDEALQQELENFAEEFANTEAAQSEDTISQLETSIQENWTDTLTQLDGAVSPEDLLAAEKYDFSDQEIYHPIIQAFSDELYRVIEAGEFVDSLYSDTFVFEQMSPQLSIEEKSALNQLRTVMYQYAANLDSEISAENQQAGFTSVKDSWLSKIQNFENLKQSDPFLAEIITRLSIASGRAPQVYDYSAVSQEGTVITIENVWNNPTGQSADFITFNFDVETDLMTQLDVVSNTVVDLSGAYDFASLYGVPVDNNYQASVEIPADYKIENYVPEESEEVIESEEPTEEVSTEENSEELPTEDSTGEELIEEEPIVEEEVTETTDSTEF
ncbi:DUF1002 domain-containing protein [Aerococcaceae bacterium WGS1372]